MLYSNIVLIGFMASGKSSVGKVLAKKLSFKFIDVDQEIAKEQGLSIEEIFSHYGGSYFRELEYKYLSTLSATKNTVISVGGGAPCDFRNSQILLSLGQIYFLDASLATVLPRLKADHMRPLAHKARELYYFRRPIYQSLGSSINVDHQDLELTCNNIIKRFKSYNQLSSIDKTKVSYPRYHIYHSPNALSSLSHIVTESGFSDHRVALVTSEPLLSILHDHISTIKTQLAIEVITIKDGEEHKRYESVKKIQEGLLSKGFNRQSLIIALGGGNVGDIAGFAAATYLRGIPIVQVPTTLLAMVDASVGGKTGVDNQYGKNLIGSFHHPEAVVIDPDTLNTLSKEDFSCGMAEVIKHAIIADEELFEHLRDDELDLMFAIKRSLKVKADIVAEDPFEYSRRALLNLGHTFAHGIEKVSDYKIKHGHAVAIGLVMSLHLSKRLGLLEKDFTEDLLFILKKFNLPQILPSYIDKRSLISAMVFDKKRDNIGLRFILPKKIGDIVVRYADSSNIL